MRLQKNEMSTIAHILTNEKLWNHLFQSHDYFYLTKGTPNAILKNLNKVQVKRCLVRNYFSCGTPQKSIYLFERYFKNLMELAFKGLILF